MMSPSQLCCYLPKSVGTLGTAGTQAFMRVSVSPAPAPGPGADGDRPLATGLAAGPRLPRRPPCPQPSPACPRASNRENPMLARCPPCPHCPHRKGEGRYAQEREVARRACSERAALPVLAVAQKPASVRGPMKPRSGMPHWRHRPAPARGLAPGVAIKQHFLSVAILQQRPRAARQPGRTTMPMSGSTRPSSTHTHASAATSCSSPSASRALKTERLQ